MKYIVFFCTLFVSMLVSSCSKEKIYKESEYQKSYKAWLKFKEEAGNSYRYTTQWSSWTGISGTMNITVVSGKITARDYKVIGWDPENPGQLITFEEWQEDATSLHTHNPTPSLTLDEVYANAKNVWLKVDKDDNYISFESRNNGIISTCGYAPRSCVDDCFIGIMISEIKKLSE